MTTPLSIGFIIYRWSTLIRLGDQLLRSFNTRVSAIECSDLVGWNRIFQEFQPSYIKEEDKKYKFSTDFSTIFLSKGIC